MRKKQNEDRKQHEKDHIQKQQQHAAHASKMDMPYTNPGYRGGAEYQKPDTHAKEGGWKDKGRIEQTPGLKGTQKRGRGS
jgi:hypothetical protein